MQVAPRVDEFVRKCLAEKDPALAAAPLQYHRVRRTRGESHGYHLYRVSTNGTQLFVKHRTAACYKDRLHLEAAALQRIWAAAGHDALGETVPRLLGYCQRDNVLVETVLPGIVVQRRLMFAALTGLCFGRAMRLMRHVAQWLENFQRASLSSQRQPMGPRIEEAQAKLREINVLSQEDAAMLRSMLENAAGANIELPVVETHGDFSLRNVLMRDSALGQAGCAVGVVDWEDAGPSDPVKDPNYWVITLARLVRFHVRQRHVNKLAVGFMEARRPMMEALGYPPRTLTDLGAIHVVDYLHRYSVRYRLVTPQWQRFYRAVCQTRRAITAMWN